RVDRLLQRVEPWHQRSAPVDLDALRVVRSQPQQLEQLLDVVAGQASVFAALDRSDLPGKTRRFRRQEPAYDVAAAQLRPSSIAAPEEADSGGLSGLSRLYLSSKRLRLVDEAGQQPAADLDGRLDRRSLLRGRDAGHQVPAQDDDQDQPDRECGPILLHTT